MQVVLHTNSAKVKAKLTWPLVGSTSGTGARSGIPRLSPDTPESLRACFADHHHRRRHHHHHLVSTSCTTRTETSVSKDILKEESRQRRRSTDKGGVQTNYTQASLGQICETQMNLPVEPESANEGVILRFPEVYAWHLSPFDNFRNFEILRDPNVS